MIKKLYLSLIAICLCLAAATPASALDEKWHSAANTIEHSVASGYLAGAVAIVIKEGEVAWYEAYGHRDLDELKPMRKDTIFRIASMTKAVTSVAIMQLVEDGSLSLEDKLSQHIPAFSRPEVIVTDERGAITGTRPASREIRVVDLLTHTSGLAYTFMQSPLQKRYRAAGVIDGVTDQEILLADVMHKLAEQPLLFDPGTRFRYGLSTDVLGYLVEVASGMTLDAYFEQHIFQPLKMQDTAFYYPDEFSSRLATLYSWSAENGLVESEGRESSIHLREPDYPVRGARAYFSGGAGLSSTAMDYARFLLMLLNEGELEGQRVLNRESVEQLRTPMVDWDGDQVPDFSLGFEVYSLQDETDGRGTAGLYTWGGAFNTKYFVDPAENMVGVFMSQARPAQGDASQGFIRHVHQAVN